MHAQATSTCGLHQWSIAFCSRHLAFSMATNRASGKYPKGKRTRANGYDRPSGWNSKTVVAAEKAAQGAAGIEVVWHAHTSA